MNDTALSEIAETAPETGAQAEPQTDPKVEAKARETGWVPLEEYKGDPSKWKPADKWKSPDEQIGAIRKKLEKAEAALDKHKRDSAERFKNMERMSATAIAMARQEVIDKYEAKIREAVRTGDEDAIDRAKAVKDKALKDLDTEAEAAKPKKGEDDGLSASDRDALEDWQDDNTWFKADAEMTAFADRRFTRLRRDDPDMTFKELLGEVRKAVEEKFPDKFARKGSASRVEGGGRDMGGGGRSAFASLPADVRAQADKFIDQGLFLEKGETKEKDRAKARDRYAQEYLKDSK